MKTRQSILRHPVFLLALALLLLNDFLLKQAFPGLFTGKLSDVAGVFVFTAFGLAFLPRYRYGVLLFSALWFIFWKSPFSQPLIDAFNRTAFYSIQRVVDYSDLWALSSIPAAAWLFNGKEEKSTYAHAVFRFGIPLLCLFAFCSTSRANRHIYGTYMRSVDANKKWTTGQSTQELGLLFRKASPNVYHDPQNGTWTLGDIFINDELTLDTRLRIRDRGKKREIQVEGYYICYRYSYKNLNERSLNSILHTKLQQIQTDSISK